MAHNFLIQLPCIQGSSYYTGYHNSHQQEWQYEASNLLAVKTETARAAAAASAAAAARARAAAARARANPRLESN
jgi:hypothetical protein